LARCRKGKSEKLWSKDHRIRRRTSDVGAQMGLGRPAKYAESNDRFWHSSDYDEKSKKRSFQRMDRRISRNRKAKEKSLSYAFRHETKLRHSTI